MTSPGEASVDDLEPAATALVTLATQIEGDERSSAGPCHRMVNYASALEGMTSRLSLRSSGWSTRTRP